MLGDGPPLPLSHNYDYEATFDIKFQWPAVTRGQLSFVVSQLSLITNIHAI